MKYTALELQIVFYGHDIMLCALNLGVPPKTDAECEVFKGHHSKIDLNDLQILANLLVTWYTTFISKPNFFFFFLMKLTY